MDMQSPLDNLVGMTLDDDWTVRSQLDRTSSAATGGQFSVGFLVERPGGQRGFLKALDFSKALGSQDPARALKGLTEAFVFEQELLQKCRSRNLDHIVSAIAHGTVRIKDTPYPIQYLIFELATDGDVRQFLDRLSTSVDWAWTMRSAHNIAVGLRQLHSIPVAHQDLKPSNVLIFDGSQSKIADLGRASAMDYDSPFDALLVAGDKTYAPPELLYQHTDADWTTRRIGCDLYHLGSMIYFFEMQIGITPALRGLLPPQCRPGCRSSSICPVWIFISARQLCEPLTSVSAERTDGASPRAVPT